MSDLSLHPSGRVDFSSLFSEPDHELEAVFGTTYCLHPETLLMLILAAVYGPGADSALETSSERISPAAIFAAIKSMEGKLKIFCQADKVAEDWNCGSEEMRHLKALLLDKFTAAVPMSSKDGSFSSFHSKVYLISFRKSGLQYRKCRYRMIVTSRNLTGNRDFDAAAVLESSGTDRRCTEEILEQVSAPEDLRKVFKNACFDTEPCRITEQELQKCHSVVSPFLDGALLKKVLPDREEKLNIFSLQSEIRKIWDESLADRYNFFSFNPALEDQEAGAFHSSIHAKLYIGDSSMILGSSNFTSRGWSHNREFNIRIHPGIPLDDLKKQFSVSEEKEFGKGLFIPYEPPEQPEGPEEEETDPALDFLLQELAGVSLKAEWDGEKKVLSIKEIDNPLKADLNCVRWKPLFGEEWKNLSCGLPMQWTMSSVRDVCRIFQCKVRHREKETPLQIFADLENGEELWEERFDQERKKQLSLTEELDYRMLIAEGSEKNLYGCDVLLKEDHSPASSEGSQGPLAPRPPVFERLLKMKAEQLKMFFKDPIREDGPDPLGLIGAFHELKSFFSDRLKSEDEKR